MLKIIAFEVTLDDLAWLLSKARRALEAANKANTSKEKNRLFRNYQTYMAQYRAIEKRAVKYAKNNS